MKTLFKLNCILFSALASLFFACSTPETTAPTVQSAVTPPAQVSGKQAWEEEWDRISKEAKKEGVVVVYGPPAETADATRKIMLERFGIKYESIAGRGTELVQRIQAERKGGVFTADIFIMGSNTSFVVNKSGDLEPIMPSLILPEVKETSLWYGGGLRFLDRGQSNVLAFTGYILAPVVLNTAIVKPDEIKSYNDLLNPKFKGKIVLNDPTVPGPGWTWFGSAGEGIMGYDYLRQFARQEPVIVRDNRLQIDWVARGRYPVGIAHFAPSYEEFKKAGAPLSQVSLSEGGILTVGRGIVGLMNKAAHPNAAKLFLNWFLTKEGQTIYSVATGFPSARLDTPKDSFDPIIVPEANKKYFNVDAEDFINNAPEHFRMAREILGIR